jgi:hypothetical protein
VKITLTAVETPTGVVPELGEYAAFGASVALSALKVGATLVTAHVKVTGVDVAIDVAPKVPISPT